MEKTESKTVIFVPYKRHLHQFFNALQSQVSVVVVDWCQQVAGAAFTAKFLERTTFGLLTIRSITKVAFQPPFYVRKFSPELVTKRPSVVVAFDLYHWYVLQCLRYKKRFPTTQLIIYVETKRWPRNPLSRIILKLFLWHLRKQQCYIDCVLTYTLEGRVFVQKQLPDVSVCVLPAPVDTQLFMPPQTSSSWLPAGKLQILMNARYSEYKRHKDLFAAMQILQTNGMSCSVTCVGRVGKGLEKIKAEARKHGVIDSVTFLSPRPLSDVVALYHSHDVLVLPSYNEAIGMVVPEAMACGLPTVTSDTVGANVYVQDGVTGYIYPTGDAVALADALARLHDDRKLAQMGKAAHEHVQQYAPNIIVKQFLQYCQ